MTIEPSSSVELVAGSIRYLCAGTLVLDREERTLRMDERPVPLSPRSLILLEALMERSRQALSKREIFESIWDRALSDAALTTAIREIRQAIGDDARHPEIIETVHGHGYRFLKAVETAANDGCDAIGEAIAPYRSVVVLPFADLSANGDQAWLARGLTDEILNSLSKMPDLLVRSWSPAGGQGGMPDPRAIGRELNVAFALRGSVRRDDQLSRFRLTVLLIRVSDGLNVWSENFDRPSADIIAVQEETALAVARSLKTVMAPDKLEEMLTLGTRSAAAYEEFLKGLALERRMLESGDLGLIDQMRGAFERARSIDRGFAEAHWYAGGYFARNPFALGPPLMDGGLDEAVARIDAAIEASDGRPESLKYRAERQRLGLDFRQAHVDIQAYLSARPRDQNGWELCARLAGYLDEYGQMADAARQLDLLDRRQKGFYGSAAITYAVLAGEAEEAIDFALRHLSVRPNDPYVCYQLHRAYLCAGQRDEARPLLDRFSSSALQQDLVLLAALRQAYADESEGALEIYREIGGMKGSSLIARWEGALLIGDAAAAVDAVRPYDSAGKVSEILDFLAYPWFDPSSLPYLDGQLKLHGIQRQKVKPLPFG